MCCRSSIYAFASSSVVAVLDRARLPRGPGVLASPSSPNNSSEDDYTQDGKINYFCKKSRNTDARGHAILVAVWHRKKIDVTCNTNVVSSGRQPTKHFSKFFCSTGVMSQQLRCHLLCSIGVKTQPSQCHLIYLAFLSLCLCLPSCLLVLNLSHCDLVICFNSNKIFRSSYQLILKFSCLKNLSKTWSLLKFWIDGFTGDVCDFVTAVLHYSWNLWHCPHCPCVWHCLNTMGSWMQKLWQIYF
jgi:hypothetical protein